MQMRTKKCTNDVCPDLKSFSMQRSMNVPNYLLLLQFAVSGPFWAPNSSTIVLAMISLPRVCSGLLLYHCDWWSVSVTNKVTFWSWKTAKTRQFLCPNLPLPVASSNNEKQDGGLVTWRRVKRKVPSITRISVYSRFPLIRVISGHQWCVWAVFRDERKIDKEKSEKISAPEKEADSSGRAYANIKHHGKRAKDPSLLLNNGESAGFRNKYARPGAFRSMGWITDLSLGHVQPVIPLSRCAGVQRRRSILVAAWAS